MTWVFLILGITGLVMGLIEPPGGDDAGIVICALVTVVAIVDLVA